MLSVFRLVTHNVTKFDLRDGVDIKNYFLDNNGIYVSISHLWSNKIILSRRYVLKLLFFVFINLKYSAIIAPINPVFIIIVYLKSI